MHTDLCYCRNASSGAVGVVPGFTGPVVAGGAWGWAEGGPGYHADHPKARHHQHHTPDIRRRGPNDDG